jgi:hypothetical protein
MDECTAAVSCALWAPEKAARYLGMTTGWLAKLRMMGGGPRYVKMARRVFYRRSDLDAWTSARVIASTSQVTAAARGGVRNPPEQ